MKHKTQKRPKPNIVRTCHYNSAFSSQLEGARKSAYLRQAYTDTYIHGHT